MRLAPLALFLAASAFALAFSVRNPLVLAQTPEQKKIVCMTLYAPVCGKIANGETKTFGNDCEAKRVNATVISQGPCPDKK